MASVVLAYSGGLDTSVALHWLKNVKNLKVFTFTANLGQGKYLEPLGERAVRAGAEASHIQDLRQRFVHEYIFPALRANAQYQQGYFLATALGRPLIASELVKLAFENSSAYVAHGCTGKGNDQVRFEASIAALAPDLKVIAPAREWQFKSREEEQEYARQHQIPIDEGSDSTYSIDLNLWGRSIECGPLEDASQPPPDDIYELTVSPEAAPDEAAQIEVGFEDGVPVSLDGSITDPLELIVKLNEIGGAHGVGRADMVEDRLVGIKSREVYEAPAATILHTAHRALEALTLSRETLLFKEPLSQEYAQLIYEGLWFTRLREALDEFFAHLQQVVTGSVRMKLYKGNCTVIGRQSPFSLYELDLSTYGPKDTFPHASAEGFIDIWRLRLKQEARQRKKLEER